MTCPHNRAIEVMQWGSIQRTSHLVLIKVQTSISTAKIVGFSVKAILPLHSLAEARSLIFFSVAIDNLFCQSNNDEIMMIVGCVSVVLVLLTKTTVKSPSPVGMFAKDNFFYAINFTSRGYSPVGVSIKQCE